MIESSSGAITFTFSFRISTQLDGQASLISTIRSPYSQTP